MAEVAIVQPKDDDPDEIPDLQPFEGKLVEITGVDQKLDASQDGSTEAVDVNGLKGRVIGWIADANKYAVEVFTGETVPVSEENLLEYEPPDPEEGGFDVCWYAQPNSLDSGMFAAMMASHLEKKGCCVVQTFLGVAGCQQAWDIAEQLQGYHVMSEDLQQEYLGREDVGQKTAWLYNDGVLTLNMDDFEALEGGDQASTALEWCDQTFTCIASHLFPYAPNFEDPELQFTPWGRTNGLVRTSFLSNGEKAELEKIPRSFTEAQELEEHNNLLESKKVCMMYLIDAEGGSLTLHAENADVVIPLEPNMGKVVVFREDQMSYTFAPTGKFLALQAWLVDEPMAYKDELDAFRNIDGPEEPQGERINIMSCNARYPGQANDPSQTWLLYLTGVDGHIEVPTGRWDIDIYYRAQHTPGFSMSRHGAMMGMMEITTFDNKFFGFDDSYAFTMAPKDRIGCELGYGTLNKAGFTKETLRGSNMGVFFGDSGSDFSGETMGTRNNVQGWEKNAYTNLWNATACNRLSWLYGMKGPTHTSETACSSSLVATGIAHMALRRKEEDQTKTSADTGVKQALVSGINTLVGAGSYIFLSGPGMLTHEGRCFTFNQSADGYARGEGCGALFLRLCSNELESMGRLAMLIGSCVNQDGRSASMTAPHGPSQSDVIKASMREAGLQPSMITIAECHGTGTSLGDPIEIGSLRAVMSKDRGDCPLLATTSKSNLGHLECGAGACGLLKCMFMLRHSLGAPNCHLCEMNPHLDVDGFPVRCQTESVDFGVNSGLTGVSSFGFGGTNARADVWGHSVKGSRSCVSGAVMKLRTVFM